jgi:hypothetical protein
MCHPLRRGTVSDAIDHRTVLTALGTVVPRQERVAQPNLQRTSRRASTHRRLSGAAANEAALVRTPTSPVHGTAGMLTLNVDRNTGVPAVERIPPAPASGCELCRLQRDSIGPLDTEAVKPDEPAQDVRRRASGFVPATFRKPPQRVRLALRARLRDDRRATQPRSTDDLQSPSNWAGVAITARTQGSTSERILGVALSRSKRDFTATERDLLNLRRPYLIQA